MFSLQEDQCFNQELPCSINKILMSLQHHILVKEILIFFRNRLAGRNRLQFECLMPSKQKHLFLPATGDRNDMSTWRNFYLQLFNVLNDSFFKSQMTKQKIGLSDLENGKLYTFSWHNKAYKWCGPFSITRYCYIFWILFLIFLFSVQFWFRCIYKYNSITLNTYICVFKNKPTKQKMEQRPKPTIAGFSSFKSEFKYFELDNLLFTCVHRASSLYRQQFRKVSKQCKNKQSVLFQYNYF